MSTPLFISAVFLPQGNHTTEFRLGLSHLQQDPQVPRWACAHHCDGLCPHFIQGHDVSTLCHELPCKVKGGGEASSHPLPYVCLEQVVEGYGQTECGAAATMTVAGDQSLGHVGPPVACNDIKLEDVKDMNYFAANNEGEVSWLGWQPLSAW